MTQRHLRGSNRREPLPPLGFGNHRKMAASLEFRCFEEGPHGTDTWLMTLSPEKGPAELVP